MLKNPFLTSCLSFFLSLSLLFSASSSAQQTTGIWKGKINRQKVEVKIIQTGDSLTGTSYYYTSANNFRRYSIKGYFDSRTNETVWWDDQLLEEHSGKLSLSIPGREPLLARADFNCPGGGKMMLDGKSYKPEDQETPNGEVHLEKSANSTFPDNWDWVIDNYTSGTNSPEIIDSIASIARRPILSDNQPKTEITEIPVIAEIKKTTPDNRRDVTLPAEQKINTPKQEEVPAIPSSVIKEKFTSREKVFVKEIPVTGDTLELRFYDNAEIDGDSISLFLNGSLILEHQKLTASAFVLKIPAASLKETSELVMVAENLGSIPPNTSYMVAIINDKRYDALLASSEGSSAMIRLVKTP